MAEHSGAALRAIAIYKFAKAAVLLVLATVAFRLVHAASLEHFADWIAQLPIRSGHGIVIRWVDALLGLTQRKFELIGIGASIYAALFLVEGWGLWRRKRWAEYLTVFATASLIPFEAWEIYHHFTWLKVLALAVNVAIVIYLWRIVRRGG
ncbi:DUF2127 domain-containing protein [Rudaea sp.]|uniref:DUF2127 domain-containing protein n=1 Tax=Rudaea sp. TaxID=2136325 RepID=UPI002ED5A759